MKKYINRKNIIIVVWIIILLTLQGISLTNSKIKALAKKEIEIQELEKKMKIPSPIEELSIKVWDNNRIAEKHLAEIENLKLEIQEHQGVYEYSLLKKRCYSEQIIRLSEDLETENWYCEDKDNLENYRGK